MKTSTMYTRDILARITELQNVQKSCHHTAPQWQTASKELQPLFREMAKRQTKYRKLVASDEPANVVRCPFGVMVPELGWATTIGQPMLDYHGAYTCVIDGVKTAFVAF